MQSQGKLHFFCGKMAAGKSTKAVKLAQEHRAVLLSEDEWLSKIYPEEIKVFDDYIKYSRRLKGALKSHIQQLLESGLSVVLDFPGNTIGQRAWFKEIVAANDIPHELHYIKASDELCLAQLKQRSKNLEAGTAFTTEEEFHAINAYFQPPTDDEGFNIIIYERKA